MDAVKDTTRIHVIVPTAIHRMARMRMIAEGRTIQGTIVDLLHAYGQYAIQLDSHLGQK